MMYLQLVADIGNKNRKLVAESQQGAMEQCTSP